MITLLTVIGVAIFGIYQVYKPASAETLYAKIEANVVHPDLAINEMEQFLKHYPEDPRAARIAKFYEKGKAVQHYNRLTRKLKIRAGMPLIVALTIRIVNMSGWVIWVVTSIFENIGTVQEGMETISQPHDVVDQPGAAPLVGQAG